MRAIFARLVLGLFGWKAEGEGPQVAKCVLVAAPHTSSWDVPLLNLMAWVYNVQIHWMMKAEMFRGIRGPFFRALGGIPIDRSQRNNMVQQCIEAFRASDELVLVIPPEGTRAAADVWKSGFYRIALGAGVPLHLGYLDYKRKRGGFGPLLELSGDPQADMARIRAFYRADMAKYPERFGDVRLADPSAGTTPLAE
jgi:1-acyl-sn-glycerol-3-phosphate acyltransferase